MPSDPDRATAPEIPHARRALVVELEARLRLAATRLPGPYRSEADEGGPAEVRSLLGERPELAGAVGAILERFLASGSVDEARLAAYSLDVAPCRAEALVAGYRRADVPAFERSKIAFPLGRALLDRAAPLPPETARWALDRSDGAAFWGAYFLRDRDAFDRDAAQQLARDPAEAAGQLWFAASILSASEFDALRDALRALASSFGGAWVAHLEGTLAAVRR